MIGIDLQNRKPIYEQIVERFQTMIVNGVLEPDSQMPSVRSLAVELSINPNTIQKAYSALEQEGYIYPVKGRGNFVSGNAGLKLKKQESVFLSLKELVERGRELGISCEEFTARAERYYREGQQGEMRFGRSGSEPGVDFVSREEARCMVQEQLAREEESEFFDREDGEKETGRKSDGRGSVTHDKN